MNVHDFDELLESVREGGAIFRGQKTASRNFVVPAPDVLGIRNAFDMSQSEFARMLGISVDTLQNWEQGRRHPVGPARALLQVAAKHPEAIRDAIVSLTKAS